jgi:hypothetical protein
MHTLEINEVAARELALSLLAATRATTRTRV